MMTFMSIDVFVIDAFAGENVHKAFLSISLDVFSIQPTQEKEDDSEAIH